jgi:predicted transcriptional regulator
MRLITASPTTGDSKRGHLSMVKQKSIFGLESDNANGFDTLNGSTDCDNPCLNDEVIGTPMEVQRWHLEQIQAGVADADAGRVFAHGKVKVMAVKRYQKLR